MTRSKQKTLYFFLRYTETQRIYAEQQMYRRMYWHVNLGDENKMPNAYYSRDLATSNVFCSDAVARNPAGQRNRKPNKARTKWREEENGHSPDAPTMDSAQGN